MSTNVWQSRALVTAQLIAIVAACSLLAGCDDGPTGPSTRAVPTPVPIPNVAGGWQGHSRTEGPSYFCGGEIPASATLAQDGTLVTGRVTTGATGLGGERSLQGELRGTTLTGTLTSNGTRTAVSGGASSTHITMRGGSTGGSFCGVTTISLSR